MAREGVCTQNSQYLEISVENLCRKCVPSMGLGLKFNQVKGFETLFIIKFSTAIFFIISVNGSLIGICNLEVIGGGLVINF